MSNTQKKVVRLKIDPVKPSDFQLAEHRYQRHDCVVPANTTKEDLENPDLWVSVAPRMRMFDEVRVIANDHSFVVYLIVLFSQGHDARLKIVGGTELGEECDDLQSSSKFDVKLAGVKKFILYNKETGEEIKSGIPTKAQAYKELEEYERALRS